MFALKLLLGREMKVIQVSVMAAAAALVLVAACIQVGLAAVPSTVPAFLWSPHRHQSVFDGVKETVNYHTIPQKDLAKFVLSEGGWSNILCPGKNIQQPVDLALVFVGRELQLQSSYLSRNKHADPALVDLLRISFEKSNFSMAFPYVVPSDEKDTMESYLVSGFRETCGDELGVDNIAVLESCSIGGDDLQKLADVQAVHNYLTSRGKSRLKGQRDLIIYCSGSSDSSKELDHNMSEGEVFSNLISSIEQSGASYSIFYASDPYRSMGFPSYRTLDRFLAEGSAGKGSLNATTYCDGVCRTKSSFLEGILVGIVFLIILISGLCCMMGIDTPTRFEAPKES